MPLRIEAKRRSALYAVRLPIVTRRSSPTVVPAGTQVKGSDHIAHRDVRNGNIFQQATVHRLQGEAVAMIENTVRDRNVLEAAVRLGPELDPPERHTLEEWQGESREVERDYERCLCPDCDGHTWRSFTSGRRKAGICTS